MVVVVVQALAEALYMGLEPVVVAIILQVVLREPLGADGEYTVPGEDRQVAILEPLAVLALPEPVVIMEVVMAAAVEEGILEAVRLERVVPVESQEVVVAAVAQVPLVLEGQGVQEPEVR